MLGGTIGSIAHQWMPAYTATAGAYALVGMGTAFAGIVRAPMTSVVMIFETTHDYAVIVPLMISNLVSFFISSRLQKQPIYDALAIQDGIHLPSSESRHRHVRRQVGAAMREATDVLPVQMSIREAFERTGSSEFRAWPVIDSRGAVGIVSAATLERQLAAGAAASTLETLVDKHGFPHVHPDQSLDLALERMGSAQLEALPVVSRMDVHKLEGIVTLHDVLDSFGVHLSGPA
jgi:CIC family chloride channel protein